MPLETGTWISDLVSSNPPASDSVSQGENHLQLIKSVAQNTFPNATKAFRFPVSIAAQTSTVTVVFPNDQNKLFPINASGGAVIVNLPDPTSGGTVNEDGFGILVVKTDGTQSAVTIVPSGAQTFNGLSGNLVLNKQNQFVFLQWSKANAVWYFYKIGSITPTDFGGFTNLASAATTDLQTVPGMGINITGTVGISGFGSGANLFKVLRFAAALVITYNATGLILPGAVNYTTIANETMLAFSDSNGNWTVIGASRSMELFSSTLPGSVPASGGGTVNYLRADGNWAVPPLPTIQKFTSGSGNYTPTTGVQKIRVRMCGGGGGGGAVRTNAGANGSDTSFGSWTAIHGNGGPAGNSTAPINGGAGGTGGVNGTGNVITRIAGGAGCGESQLNINGLYWGGFGGSNPFSGGGAPVAAGAGAAAVANTGGGGAGGGINNAQDNPGSGGGAGEYVEFWVNNPGVTAYVVGGGGNGGAQGAAGTAGGNGAAGVIIIEEFYF